MKTKINTISIARHMQANRYGMHQSTRVHIHRGDTCDGYETNPLGSRGKISDASVIRAKRAQMVILERAARQAEAAHANN